jgi:amino acid adenylation domain-containing protein
LNTALSSISVPARFAETVAKFGNRIAVSAPAAEWTYQELDHGSDLFASIIFSRLGENSEPVALLLEHDAPLIAAILGTLKANKMYVALEPAHPPEVLAAMLTACGARLLLADAKNLPLAASIASPGLTVLPVPETCSGDVSKVSLPEVSGDSDAWLMFTSGSTGTPKGVWQNHRGLVLEGEAYAELAGITSDDRVALLASCSLAASGATLLAALLAGAALYPFHVRSQGVELLAAWLAGKRITVLHTVPTVFRQLGRPGIKKNSFAAMRLVRLGGEPVLPADVEIFRQHWPESCQLMQSLSSTETGIICAKIINGKTTQSNGRLPVGNPVRGVEVFLLDDENRPIKNGGEGRIAVCSERLKQGYWKQPEPTTGKFVRDERNPNLRTFISNDLGRFLPDGSLEHLGRADSLVKIHGQHVDLGELEATLLATGFAREVVVMVHEHKPGEKQLLCFFVPKADAASPEDVRRQLRSEIPAHMVPADFIALEKLPQTVAGKIDRAALRPPLRRDTRPVSGRGIEWRDILDKRLIGIWESALGISSISRKDDFFELGGTSLQSVEILLQIEELFGVSLPPSSLVEYNTIEKLSDLLASRGDVYSPNVLVKLREGGQGRPLFLIHSAYGDVASYGLLARRLTGRPVYGLQSVGLHGESWPLTDLPAMARRYLPEILSQDPAGPYLLAGTCMGGMVAFELAQMLVQQGKTVGFLGLLDSQFPLPKSWQKPLWKKAYYALSTPVNTGWQALRWKTIRGLGWGQSHRFLPAYRRYVWRTNGQAFRRYRPNFFPGKITLFMTTEARFENDPRLMLLPMAQSAQVVKLPGARPGLFQKPTVDELAQQLQKAMDSSENGAG